MDHNMYLQSLFGLDGKTILITGAVLVRPLVEA